MRTGKTRCAASLGPFSYKWYSDICIFAHLTGIYKNYFLCAQAFGANCTIFSAAGSKSSKAYNLRPEFSINSLAFSMLVPCNLTTTGMSNLKFLVASDQNLSNVVTSDNTTENVHENTIHFLGQDQLKGLFIVSGVRQYSPHSPC